MAAVFAVLRLPIRELQPDALHAWHRLGMRGLRFHLFSPAGRPGYVRGVGLDVFEVFRPVMRELGWIMQVWCDWRALAEFALKLREISEELPVVVDHMLNIPAERGTADPSFQALLGLVGEGFLHVKLSAPYRLSAQFPNYEDAERFPCGTPACQSGTASMGYRLATSADAAGDMPDDGHLLDLFHSWTPDPGHASSSWSIPPPACSIARDLHRVLRKSPVSRVFARRADRFRACPKKIARCVKCLTFGNAARWR